MELKTEIYQADDTTAQFITSVVEKLVAIGNKKPPAVAMVHAMSLAISIAAQVFLRFGGNIDRAEDAGEIVKQGVVTTLNAYKDMNRITHGGGRA